MEPTFNFNNDHVSVNELNTSSELSVFPNPANNVINVIGDDFNGSILQMISVNGMLIREEQMDQNSYQINVSELPSGLYFLSVTSDSNSSHKRIVITR
jgi:hypothetical protein